MRSFAKRYPLSIAVILITCSVISMGCVSEPVQRIGEYITPSSIAYMQNEKVYDVDPLRLTVPVVPAQPPFRYDSRPLAEKTIGSPGYQLASSYYYNAFYEGSEGVVSISVENRGESTVFAYEFGLLDVDTDTWYGQESSTTIIPGEEKKLGYVSVDVPEGAQEMKLRLGLSVLVRTQSGQWYDYGRQYFDGFTIDVTQEPQIENPEHISNPGSIFSLMNSKIDPYDTGVRKMAAVSAKKYPGQYNIYQLCSLFDDTKSTIDYISDPRGRDLWSAPGDTLEIGAGDCDDYSILLASLVEAIGGTSRIYLTDTHAFASVYIGNASNTALTIEAIRQYYGDLPVYYTTDEYGSWLILDPTSSVYAGGLPAGTAPVKGGWTFRDTSQVIVIDVAPKDQE
jgi:transglutaminase-like putative cysteine protease